ncbi:MAG TPA: peptidylprolyl isomerase, partial [Solibacterales bacterium]|nr:peptidylprolyl isomerase [Bryobacterales bacterium]
LDWLAAEFVKPEWKADGAHAWDVKHLVKTIVTSHTYKQSSLSTAQLDEKDPDNRLLARQSRFRVEAENVRDTALAIAGLLVDQFGGPSVKPAQPEGYLAAMNFPKREYSAGKGGDLYRRSLYTQWLRTFLHPSLLTFDAPSREECTVNRVNSNTPLQALVLLNDPIFVEAARVFGQSILQAGAKTFDDRLTWAFERALNRAPDKEERKLMSALYKRTLAQYKAAPGDAAKLAAAGEAPAPANLDRVELAAMTTLARAILNLHETITRN